MSSFTCTFAAGRTECCNIIASVGLLPSYEKALLPSGHSRADGWNEAIGSIEIVISRPLQLTSDFDDYSHAVLSTLLSVVNHSYTPFFLVSRSMEKYEAQYEGIVRIPSNVTPRWMLRPKAPDP